MVFVQFTPIAGVIIFSVLLVHFIQTGFLSPGAPLVPDISKISPLKGLKDFFNECSF